MDIFQTAVTSCILIYKFFDGHGKFSVQSKSLAARFRWDSRALQKIMDYFANKKLHGEMSPEDTLLLEDTLDYLKSLTVRLEVAQLKLASRGRLSQELNRAVWLFRKDEFVELELELFEWTQRLDLRLLTLPEKLRVDVMPSLDTMTAENEKEFCEYAPHLAAQRRVESFLRQSQSSRRKQWESLWIDDPGLHLSFKDHAPARYMAAGYASRSVVVEYKPYLVHLHDDAEQFEAAKGEVGELAATVSSLDPKNIGLLKCIGFFHQLNPPSFAFIYDIPFQIDTNPPSLKSLISKADSLGRRLLPAHPLNERVELARKLAGGVLFLHSIGWVHKAICPQNVLVIVKPDTAESLQKQFPYTLGNPYLVNFQSSRSNNAMSYDAMRGHLKWEQDLYHHPDRQCLQGNENDARYLMIHDIYSLGVVLLELGLWRPLEKYASRLQKATPQGRREVLLKLAEDTQVTMGRKYMELVTKCLKLDNESPKANIKYAAQVLETLEEISTALA